MPLNISDKLTVVAKTLVVDPEGSILFLQRDPNDNNRPGGWDFPGGKVDLGEDPSTAAIREADEETGITLVNPLLAYGQAGEGKWGPVVRLLFIEYVASRPEVTLSHEHGDYAWITAAEMIERTDYAFHKQLLTYLSAQGLFDVANAGKLTTTCRGLVANAEGKILIARRSPTDPFHPGKWDVPGGQLEVGESLEAAAVREVQEEVGVTLANLQAVYAVTAPRPNKSATWVFFAGQTTSEPVLGDEHDELEWINLAELSQYTDYDILTGMQQFVSANPQKVSL